MKSNSRPSSLKHGYYPMWLLLLVLCLAGLSVYLFLNKNELKLNPFHGNLRLSNLSAMASDGKGGLYVISDAKQKLEAIDAGGRLKYQISQSSSGSRSNFTEAAVDGAGRLYVLNTILDSYGLYVVSEEIDRYTPDGKPDGRLFQWNGDGQSKRVGQIKSLQIKDNKLTFFISKADEVQQKQLSLDTGRWEQPFSFKLPPDRYVSEVYGTDQGSLYYTTKRGAIYQVGADGASKMLYPLPTMSPTHKNFPEQLKIDSTGSLTFIDRSVNAITRLTPGAAQPIDRKSVV